MNALVPQTPISPSPSATAGLSLLPAKVARELACDPRRDEVLAECRSVIHASEPVTVSGFAETFERLQLHYPAPPRSPAQEKLLRSDWLRLVGHLPPDILREAADRWLMSDNRWMPTPGQLNAIAEPMWKVRDHLARRAREAMDLMAA